MYLIYVLISLTNISNIIYIGKGSYKYEILCHDKNISKARQCPVPNANINLAAIAWFLVNISS